MVKKFTTAVLAFGLGVIVSVNTADAIEQKNGCPQKEYAMGIRYFQKSGEVMALQKQAYNLATARFNDFLAKYKGDPATLAIICDLDETVIDNSELLVRDMNACHDFTTWDTWKVWEREGEPKLIPGALDFLSHVNKSGVNIYYISNRYQENKPATLATLKKLNLPQVNAEHVLLYGPPKKERRASVTEKYTLIMQLGDSLHDFSGEFADVKRDLNAARDLVEKNTEKFGTEYIVFPNSTYGYWSKAKLDSWSAPLKTE